MDKEITLKALQLGVNKPPIEPYDAITVEKVFKMVEAMCAFKDAHPETMDVPYAIVWDSIANTLTEKGSVSDDINQVLGEKARVLSHYLPKYVQKLNKYKIALVAINQLRDKIDIGIFKQAPDLKFLGDKQLPGGKSLLFNLFSPKDFNLPASMLNSNKIGFNGFFLERDNLMSSIIFPPPRKPAV